MHSYEMTCIYLELYTVTWVCPWRIPIYRTFRVVYLKKKNYHQCRDDDQLIVLPRFDEYSEKRAKSLSREHINRKDSMAVSYLCVYVENCFLFNTLKVFSTP